MICKNSRFSVCETSFVNGVPRPWVRGLSPQRPHTRRSAGSVPRGRQARTEPAGLPSPPRDLSLSASRARLLPPRGRVCRVEDGHVHRRELSARGGKAGKRHYPRPPLITRLSQEAWARTSGWQDQKSLRLLGAREVSTVLKGNSEFKFGILSYVTLNLCPPCS